MIAFGTLELCTGYNPSASALVTRQNSHAAPVLPSRMPYICHLLLGRSMYDAMEGLNFDATREQSYRMPSPEDERHPLRPVERKKK